MSFAVSLSWSLVHVKPHLSLWFCFLLEGCPMLGRRAESYPEGMSNIPGIWHSPAVRSHMPLMQAQVSLSLCPKGQPFGSGTVYFSWIFLDHTSADRASSLVFIVCLETRLETYQLLAGVSLSLGQPRIHHRLKMKAQPGSRFLWVNEKRE